MEKIALMYVALVIWRSSNCDSFLKGLIEHCLLL